MLTSMLFCCIIVVLLYTTNLFKLCDWAVGRCAGHPLCGRRARFYCKRLVLPFCITCVIVSQQKGEFMQTNLEEGGEPLLQAKTHGQENISWPSTTLPKKDIRMKRYVPFLTAAILFIIVCAMKQAKTAHSTLIFMFAMQMPCTFL